MIFEQNKKRWDKRPMFSECLRNTYNGNNNVLVCGLDLGLGVHKSFSSIYRYFLKGFEPEFII